MKLVLIAYNEAIDAEVLDMLNSRGVTHYTQWTKTFGRGEASEPHLGTHVWPKANSVLAIVTDEETAKRALQGVRKLRETLSREGIKAFVIPCEEVT
jgi:nitrogen regulatory protein PII